MSDPVLTARIEALEAREEIRAMIAEYCDLNDRLAAVDEMMDLFVEDAVLVNPSGEHSGRTAIRDYYGAVFDGTMAFARHHVTNQVIEILEPGVARHRANFLAFLGRGGASRIAFGRYDDMLVRTSAGWKFTRKGNDVVRIADIDEGWAHALEAQVKGQ